MMNGSRGPAGPRPDDLHVSARGGEGERWFGVRVEVVHPAGAEVDLAALPDVVDTTTRWREEPAEEVEDRFGRLPTVTLVTFSIRAVDGPAAAQVARAHVTGIDSWWYEEYGEFPAAVHPRRTGWAPQDPTGDAGNAWTWDLPAHDCALDPIRTVYGMVLRSPGPGERWVSGGCCVDPVARNRYCDVCGYRWGSIVTHRRPTEEDRAEAEDRRRRREEWSAELDEEWSAALGDD